MLTGKETVDYFLESSNFSNYQIVKIKSGNSKCIFNPSGKTIIELNEQHHDSNKIDDIFVGAHEAAHALIYNSDNRYFKRVKKSVKIYLGLFFLMHFTDILALFFITNMFLKIALISTYNLILYTYAKIHGPLIEKDESKADDLALQLIIGNLKSFLHKENNNIEIIKAKIKQCYQLRNKKIKKRSTSINVVTLTWIFFFKFILIAIKIFPQYMDLRVY